MPNEIANFQRLADVTAWRRKKHAAGDFIEIRFVPQKVVQRSIVAGLDFALQNQTASKDFRAFHSGAWSRCETKSRQSGKCRSNRGAEAIVIFQAMSHSNSLLALAPIGIH